MSYAKHCNIYTVKIVRISVGERYLEHVTLSYSSTACAFAECKAASPHVSNIAVLTPPQADHHFRPASAGAYALKCGQRSCICCYFDMPHVRS